MRINNMIKTTISLAVLCYNFDRNTTASDKKVIKIQLIWVPKKRTL